MKRLLPILAIFLCFSCEKTEVPELVKPTQETKTFFTFSIQSADETIVVKNCVLSFTDTTLTPTLTKEAQYFTLEGDSDCVLTFDVYYPDGLPLELGYTDSLNVAYKTLDITAKYMGYSPITFNPSVDDYRDMGTGL